MTTVVKEKAFWMTEARGDLTLLLAFAARQRQLSNAVSGCVSTTQLPFSWDISVKFFCFFLVGD